MDEDWHAYVHSAQMALGAAIPIKGGQTIPQWLFKATAAISSLKQGDFGVLCAHLESGIAILPSDYNKYTKVHNFQVDVTREEKFRIISAACAGIGDKYCVPTIVGDVCEVNCERANEFDCSDFMNAAFGVVRYLQNPIDGEGLITPRDIVMSPLAIPEPVV